MTKNEEEPRLVKLSISSLAHGRLRDVPFSSHSRVVQTYYPQGLSKTLNYLWLQNLKKLSLLKELKILDVQLVLSQI